MTKYDSVDIHSCQLWRCLVLSKNVIDTPKQCPAKVSTSSPDLAVRVSSAGISRREKNEKMRRRSPSALHQNVQFASFALSNTIAIECSRPAHFGEGQLGPLSGRSTMVEEKEERAKR